VLDDNKAIDFAAQDGVEEGGIREAQSWPTDRETCFWGISFQLTGRKSYGRGKSLNEAKVGFTAECAAWGERQKGQDCRRDECKR
jgi:hypothetical protein